MDWLVDWCIELPKVIFIFQFISDEVIPNTFSHFFGVRLAKNGSETKNASKMMQFLSFILSLWK